MTVLLDTAKVAERLGIKVSKVRYLCRQGKFPGAFQNRIGGRWLIPESALAGLQAKESSSEMQKDGIEVKIVELQLAAHFREFENLTAEIRMRLEAQHTLLNITVVLVAGSLAFLMAAVEQGNLDILLFVPIVFIIIAWWYIGYNMMIGQTAQYVYGPLARKVNHLLSIYGSPNNQQPHDDLVWQWLSFQFADFSTRTRHIYIYNSINLIKYSPWFVPSLFSVIAFVGTKALLDTPWAPHQVILIVLDGILWLGTFISLVFFVGWRPSSGPDNQLITK